MNCGKFKGVIPMNANDLEEALEMGMDWSLREGYSWAEDKEHCEEFGRMLQADPSKGKSMDMLACFFKNSKL